MPIADYLRMAARGGAQVAPLIGAGIGSYFGMPQAGFAGGRGIGALLSQLGQQPGGPGQEQGGLGQQQGIPPEMAAQQQMLQQMQQPIGGGFQGRAQEMQRQFHEDYLPRVASQVAGGGRSSAFSQAIGSAGAELQSRLAALGEDVGFGERGQELQRQEQLASYLGGQQRLGLGAQELGQRRREAGMTGLTGLGGYAGQAGQLGLQRGLAPIYQEGGQAGWLGPLMAGLGQAGGQAARMYFGGGMG